MNSMDIKRNNNTFMINGSNWNMDEIHFNATTHLWMVVNTTTNVIVGYQIYSDNLDQELIQKLCHDLQNRYDPNHKVKIHSETNIDPLLTKWIEERIKRSVALELIQKDSRPLRHWRKTIPQSFKLMAKSEKSRNEEFQDRSIAINFASENLVVDFITLNVQGILSSKCIIPVDIFLRQ
jgi:hypothetical protein